MALELLTHAEKHGYNTTNCYSHFLRSDVVMERLLNDVSSHIQYSQLMRKFDISNSGQ